MTNQPMMGRLLAWGLLMIVPVAQADVYRCEMDGHTVYTDRPCSGERIDAELAGRAGTGNAAAQASRARRESTAQSGMARHWQQEDTATLAEQRKKDAQWLADYAREKQIEEAFQQRKVVAGMTQDQIRFILGTPDRVWAESSAQGQDEFWEYSDQGAGRATVSFRDGKVFRYRAHDKRRH